MIGDLREKGLMPGVELHRANRHYAPGCCARGHMCSAALMKEKEYHLMLDASVVAGYPSLNRAGDRRIGIVFEGSQSHLVFEPISLDELLKC